MRVERVPFRLISAATAAVIVTTSFHFEVNTVRSPTRGASQRPGSGRTLPQGFKEEVRERGSTLSTGQKQLISGAKQFPAR